MSRARARADATSTRFAARCRSPTDSSTSGASATCSRFSPRPLRRSATPTVTGGFDRCRPGVRGRDLAQLTATVRSYTKQVLGAFAAQGTPVDTVSIGNEIRNGILWPVGQVNWSADTGWDNLTTLLKAGVEGARRANRPGGPDATAV
jgi:hypothetical protein